MRSKMTQLSWFFSVMLLVISILRTSKGAPITGRDLRFLINEHTMRAGTPTQMRVWIYSKNSMLNLRVQGPTIDFLGTRREASSVMIIKSVNIKGHITIQSERENSFVCVNEKDGTLVIESNTSNSTRCLFREYLQFGYTKYQSVFNPQWYIGSKRSGHVKQPPKTGKMQKAVDMLAIRIT